MADWRNFKFNPAGSAFERNYNYLCSLNPEYAVAYAVLPKSDTNHFKRQIDAYAKSTTLGNVLISTWSEPGAAPWERISGMAEGWYPPRVELLRDGKTFKTEDRTYTLPEVDPAHVRKAAWWMW
jgi:hypothetical protein